MGEQSNYCWALYLGPSPLWAQRWVGQRGVDPKGGRPNANFHLSLLEMSGSFFFVLLHFSKKKGHIVKSCGISDIFSVKTETFKPIGRIVADNFNENGHFNRKETPPRGAIHRELLYHHCHT